MKRLLISTLAALWLSTLASDVPIVDAESQFWSEPDKNVVRYEYQLKLADRLAVRATARGLDRRRAIQLASMAIDAYRLAVQIKPTEPNPHYRIALVTHAFLSRENVSPPRYLRQEIEHYNLFEKKAPLDPRMQSVFFSRAIARTKLQGKANFALALLDYDSALELIDHSDQFSRQNSSAVGNRAELLMMMGRMRESIAAYEVALEYADRPSTGYGLAVALDRDGQRTRARHVAALYARGDRQNILADPNGGVFFVPRGEKYYYIAIRAEGLGDKIAAAEAYRAFIRMVPTSRWISNARKNLEAISPTKKSTRRKGRR